MQMRFGDIFGRFFVIGFAPGVPQPVRRIETTGVLRFDDIGAFFRDAAQHRIGQLVIAAAVMIALHLLHGDVQHGVRRAIEKQELRAALMRISRKGPARSGKPFSMNWPSTSSNCP